MLKKNNLLIISSAIFVGFLILNLVPVLSGTAHCSMLPSKDEERMYYCPNCPPGHAYIVTDDPDGVIPKGQYGCFAANEKCMQWMDEDLCDWTQGVHVCKPVCSYPELMPDCNQVSKGQTTWISNTGQVIPQGWLLDCCGFVPAGGCCKNPTDCISDCATGKYEYFSDCDSNYRCSFSSYNGLCKSDEDCSYSILFPPFDKLVCLKSPSDWSGETKTCRECVGNVQLSMPYQAPKGQGVYVTFSGFSDCYGRTAYLKKGSCDSWGYAAKCEIGPDGTCKTWFSSPCRDGTYTYYACVNKDRDETFIDLGEQTSRSIIITGGYCARGGGGGLWLRRLGPTDVLNSPFVILIAVVILIIMIVVVFSFTRITKR